MVQALAELAVVDWNRPDMPHLDWTEGQFGLLLLAARLLLSRESRSLSASLRPRQGARYCVGDVGNPPRRPTMRFAVVRCREQWSGESVSSRSGSEGQWDFNFGFQVNDRFAIVGARQANDNASIFPIGANASEVRIWDDQHDQVTNDVLTIFVF